MVLVISSFHKSSVFVIITLNPLSGMLLRSQAMALSCFFICDNFLFSFCVSVLVSVCIRWNGYFPQAWREVGRCWICFVQLRSEISPDHQSQISLVGCVCPLVVIGLQLLYREGGAWPTCLVWLWLRHYVRRADFQLLAYVSIQGWHGWVLVSTLAALLPLLWFECPNGWVGSGTLIQPN